MRRFAISIVTLALVAAACGGGGEAAEVPQVPEAAGFVPPAEGVALAYSYAEQQALDYRFGMSLDMTATIDGLDAAMGAPDGPMEMGIDMAGNIGYSIAPGADEGTSEITLGVGFDSLDVRKMTVGGESMLDQVPEGGVDEIFATEGLIPEMTVVVDGQGNLLSLRYGDEEIPAGLLGGDPFGGSAMPGGGLGPETLFGPSFPTDKLSVGSAWSVADQRDLPFGGPVDTNTEYRVAGTEVVRGRNLWVIESTTTTSDMEFDMGDMLESMASDPDLAATGFDSSEMMGAMTEGMDMKFVIKPRPTKTTTWFDADAGLVIKTYGEGRVAMDMEMAMFGETMTMDVEMDMSLVMELQESDAA